MKKPGVEKRWKEKGEKKNYFKGNLLVVGWGGVGQSQSGAASEATPITPLFLLWERLDLHLCVNKNNIDNLACLATIKSFFQIVKII